MTGVTSDQLQDKRHWLSVTCVVTRAGDEDTSIINVTYPLISAWRIAEQVVTDS